MRNATNPDESTGKSLNEQTILLAVDHEELRALRSLAQNPHPDYLQNPHAEAVFSDLYGDLRVIVEGIETLAAFRPYREAPNVGTSKSSAISTGIDSTTADVDRVRQGVIEHRDQALAVGATEHAGLMSHVITLLTELKALKEAPTVSPNATTGKD
jgi:hypothetical protein